MPIESDDVFVERYGAGRYTQEHSFFEAFICLSMDVFFDRQQLLYLPESYTKESVVTLRLGMKDYSYSLLQNLDKGFLMKILRMYEFRHGADAMWDIVCWIREAGHDSARLCYQRVFDEVSRLQRLGEPEKIPARVDRFHHLRLALTDSYLAEDIDFVMTETLWDEQMVALQEHEYHGEMENTFNPGEYASTFASNLFPKIAWENASQGGAPDPAEMEALNQWIRSTSRYASEDDLSVFWLDPRLRAEYVRRGIVRE